MRFYSKSMSPIPLMAFILLFVVLCLGSPSFAATASSSPVSVSVTVVASGDYYKGYPKMAFVVDNKQVAWRTVTASHANNAWQTFTFNLSLSHAPQTIGVDFLNDAYAGSPSKDRNLYVKDIVVNGTTLLPNQGIYEGRAGGVAMYSAGTLTWNVASLFSNTSAACGSVASGSTTTKTVSTTTGSIAATTTQCPYGGTQPTTTTVTQTYLCTSGTLTAQGSPVSSTVDTGSPTCNAPASCGNIASGSTTTKTVSTTTGTIAATTAQCPNGGTQPTTTTVTQTYLCTNGALTAQGSPISSTVDTGSASCNPAPTNGACGSSNEQTLASTPTNLCNTGTASAVSGSGPWSWSCSGSNGGTTATCSAQLKPPPVNGACGSSSGMTLPSAPTTNLCSTGTASTVSGTGPWSWSCAGSNGGTTASCSAQLLPPPVNGTCGSSNGQTIASTPTNLCNSGAASTVSGSGPWSWSCAGSNSGTTASCSAQILPPPVNGVCGTFNGATLESAPTTNLCSTGTASSVTGTGPWDWSCAGSNGGTTASCSAQLAPQSPPPPVNGACGSSSGATLASAPTINLCSIGTASSVTGSGPWSWSCSGSNGGTTASCSASVSSPQPAQVPGPSANLFNNPYYTCTNNYYVAPNGKDTNSGTSPSSPWLTLQHANNAMPAGGKAAGSCINVAPGIYASGVSISNGGNAASSAGYVVYRCAQIDACTITNSSYAFTWNTSTQPMTGNYVIVDGFTMSASAEVAYGQGVLLWPGNNNFNRSVHHIWILNSVVSGYGQSGLQMNQGEYLYAIHNTIYNNSNATCDAQGSGISMGWPIALSNYTPTADDLSNPMVGNIGSTFRNAIEWNVLYNNALTKCTYDTDGNNIILDTWSWNFLSTPVPYTGGGLVAFNVVYNAGGGGVHVFNSENVTVANNTCYNNYLDTINTGSGRACIDTEGTYSSTVINNIAVSIQTAKPSAPCYQDYGVAPNTQWNNAIVGAPPTSSSPPNTYAHNITYLAGGAVGCQPEVGLWQSDVGRYSTSNNLESTNPLWVNVGATSVGTETTQPVGANFALQAKSPAIGYGLAEPYLPASSVDAGACASSLSTCPSAVAVAATNGACGTSNGSTLTSAPTTNFCSTGAASAVTGSGPWTWSCSGSNGGTTASCSASLAVAPVNGACGTFNGATLASKPTTNLCSTGAASAVSGSGPWSWNCAGSNGGTTALCSAQLAPSPVNGACGSSNGQTLSSTPTNLCNPGTASTISGSGPWSWSCMGLNGGATASCSASLAPAPVNGACGLSSGDTLASIPTSGLCSTGTASSVNGSGPWTWSCAGSNRGTTASCSALSSATNTTKQVPGPSQALFDNPYYSCVRNYYVATTGSDTNPGTQASPWKTLQHADTMNLGAGACVNVAPGTYNGIKVTHGGNVATATGYLVYRCTTMDACTITGNGGHNGNGSVDLDFTNAKAGVPNTVNYVQFDGFELLGKPLATQGPWGVGFNVWNGTNNQEIASHHIWLLNSIVHGFSQAGIGFAASDYFCAIHNVSYDNANATCDAQGSGIGMNIAHPVQNLSQTSDDITNPNPLIGTWQRGDGQFFHIVFEWNIAYNNALTQCGTVTSPYDTDGNGIIFDTNAQISGQSNSVNYPYPMLAAFNVSYNNGGGGVHVFASAHVTVANNSCFNNYIDPANAGGGGCIDSSWGFDNTFINNIAVAVPGAHSACAYNVSPYNMWNSAILGSAKQTPLDTFSHNVTDSIGPGAPGCYGEIALFDNGAGKDVYSATTNKEHTDPLWVNVGSTSIGDETTPPNGTDFRLQAGSPAIGYAIPEPYLPSYTTNAGAYQ